MKTTDEKEKLIQSTLRLADKGFRELFPFLPKEWLELDLTAGQLRALLLLYTNGPTRMSDISSSLGVSMATATGIIDRMVERGIVIRESDPNDRRIVRCRVSREGEKVISGLWRSWSERAKVMLRALDRPKLLAVRAFLEAMLEAGENTRGQW
ncbi:MAG: MarR family transcriptional regulator [Dehalococcoidia bacterium]|nr:MarR family transcriptional regulator [Dehalococcoidia bacterium]